jgi:hypothetical protein
LWCKISKVWVHSIERRFKNYDLSISSVLDAWHTYLEYPLVLNLATFFVLIFFIKLPWNPDKLVRLASLM